MVVHGDSLTGDFALNKEGPLGLGGFSNLWSPAEGDFATCDNVMRTKGQPLCTGQQQVGKSLKKNK